MASIVGVTGFLDAVLNLQENAKNEELDGMLAELNGTFGTNGEAVLEVFTTLDEAFLGKTFAFTSEAIRKQGAENAATTILERLSEKKDQVDAVIEKISLVVGIVSLGVSIMALVAKVGIAITMTAMGAAAVTSTTFAFFAGLASLVSTVSLFLGQISIMILCVSVGVMLAYMISQAFAKENKADYQTKKFDYIFDYVTMNGLETNVLYQSALDQDDHVGDINASKQWKWVALCFSKDTAAGSPVVADENGAVFKALQGDPSKIDGYEDICHFGERDAADFNAYCSKGKAVYVHYTTEESLSKRQTAPVTAPAMEEPVEPASEEPVEPATEEPAEPATEEPAEPATEEPAEPATEEPAEPATEEPAEPVTEEPAEPGAEPGNTPETATAQSGYIADIIIGIGKDAQEAKSGIVSHSGKYFVFDYNLSPDRSFYTYIGYSLTEDSKAAITDIRVAPYAGGADKLPVTYGDISYTQVDILGFYIGKGNKQGVPATDAMYYTKDTRAGSPIAADSFHVFESHINDYILERGWEPVSYFGADLPYNFNTEFDHFESVWDGPYFGTDSSTADLVYYGSKGDHDLNSKKQIFLFFEPTEKYTSGTRYLSGMFFVGGYNTTNNKYVSGEIEHDVEEFCNFWNDYPRCESYHSFNFARTISDRSYNSMIKKTQQYLYYTWTYNPKRAVSDIAIYQGDSFTVTLPYAMSKPTDGINRNYVASISMQQQYTPDLDMVARFVSPYNCYMTFDSMIIASGNYRDHIADSYTQTLPEGVEFGYEKLRFLPTGLYISGPVDALGPLTLNDIVMVTGNADIETKTEGSKVSYSFSGYNYAAYHTLEGDEVLPDAARSYRPVVEMKNPESKNPFDLAYPETWDEDGDYRNAANPVYMFIRGQLETKKTYISSLSIGAFSREQYKEANPSASNSMVKAVDMMVNNQAMVMAVAGCSDELIVKNIAAKNQSDCWYNKQKSGKSNKSWPSEVPAAYIGVSRTDSPTKAIRGVILYKTTAKTAPNTIDVDNVSYICAGVSSPIIMNDGKYFLYYTYNSGSVPGVPIKEIRIDDLPIIDGAATNCCVLEGDNELYGDPDQYQYIHLVYDHADREFFNKLYIGTGSTERAAMADLLSQGCTEYLKIDLNKNVQGETVFLGYRSASPNWEAILSGGDANARNAEWNRQLQEAIYDIALTHGEPYNPDGIISKGIYYTPVSDKNLNAGCRYGAEVYMYCATPYHSLTYNKRTNSQTAMPDTVFSSYIKYLAVGENGRVPYVKSIDSMWAGGIYTGNYFTSSMEDFYPWEYVMQREDVGSADLNYGAVACNGDYCSDVRLHMFVKRADGNIKPAGKITGGFAEATYEIGDVYVKR